MRRARKERRTRGRKPRTSYSNITACTAFNSPPDTHETFLHFVGQTDKAFFHLLGRYDSVCAEHTGIGFSAGSRPLPIPGTADCAALSPFLAETKRSSNDLYDVGLPLPGTPLSWSRHSVFYACGRILAPFRTQPCAIDNFNSYARRVNSRGIVPAQLLSLNEPRNSPCILEPFPLVLEPNLTSRPQSSQT